MNRGIATFTLDTGAYPRWCLDKKRPGAYNRNMQRNLILNVIIFLLDGGGNGVLRMR